MTEFLLCDSAAICSVTMSEQVSDPVNTVYKRGVRQVLLITLCLNIVVVILKLVAGMLAGSLSIISDTVHSTGDSINNIVGLVVMKYATAEPDEGHPYGHAKFETLAALPCPTCNARPHRLSGIHQVEKILISK